MDTETTFVDIYTPTHGRRHQSHVSDSGSENEIITDSRTDPDRGWTVKTNLLLILWLTRCLLNLQLHYVRYRRAKLIYDTMMIFYVVVSSFSSSLSFFSFGQNDGSTTINLVIGFTTLFSAIVAGITAMLKLNEAIGNEKYVITKFSKMIRDMEKVLYTNVEDRPPAKDFLSNISDKYYKYHSASDTLEENIEDMGRRLKTAQIIGNSSFPDQPSVGLSVDKKGEINISETLEKAIKQSCSKRLYRKPADPSISAQEARKMLEKLYSHKSDIELDDNLTVTDFEPDDGNV